MHIADDEKELLSRIAAIVEKVSGLTAAEVLPDKSFSGDLALDSLSIVEIAFSVQEEVGVEIPEEDLARLITVGDLLDFVRKHAEES
ncbi:acyl carrier protein [Sinosporangium siamense]|uniref:Acyl carrier protein n=1 Tax=Sinosporangium siamense TaxID=1367973 RepID=A0A919RDD4_9ACTN|nr:acyl carrier protein [Sinosporangium siamense]GII90695.1 hypothetical protein Ssi02_09260 [Sinosporangium siamense]